MIKMLKVEWIKEKRAANSTLKYIVPVIFLLFDLNNRLYGIVVSFSQIRYLVYSIL